MPLTITVSLSATRDQFGGSEVANSTIHFETTLFFVIHSICTQVFLQYTE